MVFKEIRSKVMRLMLGLTDAGEVCFEYRKIL